MAYGSDIKERRRRKIARWQIDDTRTTRSECSITAKSHARLIPRLGQTLSSSLYIKVGREMLVHDFRFLYGHKRTAPCHHRSQY